MNNRKRTLGFNSLINGIRSVLGILFPLITFKYASNILKVDNIGKYNFSASVVSYFVFFAALGINAYSVRTGAPLRENKQKVQKFANEIFTINIISTAVSYFLLGILLFIFQNNNYKELIFILSIQIIFKTLGVEWLYSMYEDYLFITLRSVAMQIICLLLLVIFVNDINDVNKYAMITVLSSAGTGIIDFVYSRKYTRLRFTSHPNLGIHLKPILIIFAMNVSTLIYVNSDTTLLGVLSTDYNTGLYGISTKIYTGIKTFLWSLIAVSIPRLSYYYTNNEKEKYQKILSEIYQIVMTLVFPIMAGVVSLSRELILILSDASFFDAELSLKILSVAILFSCLSGIYGQCVLIPLRKEKTLLVATILSAVTNICINLVLIPQIQQNGAAITTVLAEVLVFGIAMISVKNEIKINKWLHYIVKPGIGAVAVYFLCIWMKAKFHNPIISVIVCALISVGVYIVIEITIGNDIVASICKRIMDLFKRGKKNVI